MPVCTVPLSDLVGQLNIVRGRHTVIKDSEIEKTPEGESFSKVQNLVFHQGERAEHQSNLPVTETACEECL